MEVQPRFAELVIFESVDLRDCGLTSTTQRGFGDCDRDGSKSMIIVMQNARR